MKTPCYFLFSFFLFVSCATGKKQQDFSDKERLIFGEGGGFTGAVKEYCVLKNGYLFQKEEYEKSYTFRKKIKRKAAGNFFKTYNQKEIHTLNLNEPGNKYYFIVYYKKDKMYRITWGRNQETVPESVKELYRSLKQSLKID